MSGSGRRRQLAEIARRVSAQKGWEFRAIYLNPSIDEAPAIAEPTPGQLQAAFGEVEALTDSGHRIAAFSIAWAALESIARLANVMGGSKATGGSLQAIQTLAEAGYVANESAEYLRKTVKLRNAIVHGDLGVDISKGQVEALLKRLRAIAAKVETSHVRERNPES